ncbi:hypothetical protein M413DRAFT_23017 [Hebeloma cylindrosporum]|uniref:Uncharacterized protein n=1 Tax=Hebeloma cylindrosporum TaxID=76867 RepID=A0A0C2Z0D4_HEBCY|nr:hypothetical protein M413DRAFT_23017 [Hebeloma cylindrosporum h7]
MSGALTDIQRRLLKEARDKLLQSGGSVEEYSLLFREGPSSRVFLSPQPFIPTPNVALDPAQHTGAHYSYQPVISTSQPSAFPFTSQVSGGMDDTGVEIHQPPNLNTIPPPGPAPVPTEAWTAATEDASNSGEMDPHHPPELSLGTVTQRPSVAEKLHVDLSANANARAILLRHQAPAVLLNGSNFNRLSTDSFSADSQHQVVNHQNNLASAGSTFFLDQQHMVTNVTQGAVADENTRLSLPAKTTTRGQNQQNPHNHSSMVSSNIGGVRTARRTRRLQSTPISRPGMKWPRFFKDGSIVCDGWTAAYLSKRRMTSKLIAKTITAFPGPTGSKFSANGVDVPQ